MADATLIQAIIMIMVACIGGLCSGAPVAFALYKGIHKYMDSNAHEHASIVKEALDLQGRYNAIENRVDALEESHERHTEEVRTTIGEIRDMNTHMSVRIEKMFDILLELKQK